MKMNFFVALFFVIFVSSAEPQVWDYSKFTSWVYHVDFVIVILHPDDFVKAREYYFKDRADKRSIVAFTVFHDKPVMFVQAKRNLQPSNDDLGHELKHVINYYHKKSTGYNRFPEPCSEWK